MTSSKDLQVCVSGRSSGKAQFRCRNLLGARLKDELDLSRSPLAVNEADEACVWQSRTCLACTSFCRDWTWACRACFCCCSSAAAAVAEASAALRWLFTLCCSSSAAAASATCSADPGHRPSCSLCAIHWSVRNYQLIATVRQAKGVSLLMEHPHAGCLRTFQLWHIVPAMYCDCTCC